MLLALILGGVTITLSPEAKVRGTEIELGHIAAVAGGDEAEVSRVRALRLGYAPAPGYSRLLVAARVQGDVARAIPGLEITLAGAGACRVFPATERVLAAAIESAAKSEVLRQLEGRDVELDLAASVPDLEVPSGDKPIELRVVLTDGVRRGGPINVPVRVLVDGNLYRTVWTNWRLAVWEEASVLVAPVRVGETITLDMLERRRVASPGSGPDAALPALLAAGSTAARDLPAGQPLREVDVVRPLLVKRGDALFLEVRRNQIHARINVIADQDARAGERIRVSVPDTERSLSATVVARDLAVIELSSQGSRP